MNLIYLILLSTCVIFFACTSGEDNPFFDKYETPFEVPPFEQVKEHHYLPAFIEGMKQEQAEVAAIADNPEPATFENTIAALDRTGLLLRRVNDVFSNLTSAHTSDSLQSISKRIAPLISKHNDDIFLNNELFQRVKTVFAQKDTLNLTVEQNTLLKEYYDDFVRGGANLAEADKQQLRDINEELSVLSINFGENVLKEDNSFELVIADSADLSGLKPAQISTAAETAKERGHDGKWAFTLHKPSLIPFLQNSDKRELRERMFKGYINRGDNNNEFDNKETLLRMAELRISKAGLLGYDNHAGFVLANNMAQNPKNVYKLLDQLWQPALVVAKKEAYELQSMLYREGNNFKLEPWDWWYYAEKLKKAKYDLDDEALRPYFTLENVRNGVFALANKLFGITFTERTDIPVYHEDVQTFEVKEADGSHIGIYFADYFPRASKRGGAWMSSYRKQAKIDGRNITPLITNVSNVSKPTGDKPALLSPDEVETVFHEFGHALHGLLSDCTYYRLSGTSVARDFVEMPSQVMENWAFEPELLQIYAKHYENGEVIPQDLVAKVKKARKFNQGFKTVEYLAASFLDLDWHTLTSPPAVEAETFEKRSLDKIGLIPEIVARYRSPYFRHIFSGGYSSGYYSYIWAEVLDADAYQAFKETSLFDQKTAQAFRNMLAAGGTEDAMTLYKRFRGREPEIEPLLARRGLK